MNLSSIRISEFALNRSPQRCGRTVPLLFLHVIQFSYLVHGGCMRMLITKTFPAVCGAFASLLISNVLHATELNHNQQMLFAAAIVLSDVSARIGSIILKPDGREAKFADGSATFRKLSKCRYAQSGVSTTGDEWYEVIDFKALSGQFRYSSRLGVESIIFDGTSPQTRCFMFAGQDGCMNFIQATVGPAEQQRLIDDLNFIFKDCPTERRDTFPY